MQSCYRTLWSLKDTGVRLKGETVWNLTVVFLQMWEASAFEKEHIDYLRYKKLSDCAGDILPGDCRRFYVQSIRLKVSITDDHIRDEYLYITTPYLNRRLYAAKSEYGSSSRVDKVF